MNKERNSPNEQCISFLEALDAEDRALNQGNLEPDPNAVAYEEARAKYQAARLEGDTAKIAAAEDVFRKLLFARLHYRGRSALCFSGGGIRSATFGLGILQGLATYSLQPESGVPDC